MSARIGPRRPRPAAPPGELAVDRGADAPVELFFPIGKTGRAVTETQQAKAICAICPVRTHCLAFALKTHQDYGIWGGRDADERRALHRQQRRRLA